ncbi:MAG TPA: hypothetical protein VMJ10_18860 [Kofleriaceae bacterium]|nr:hypothetical protein [Kofleriaceae bacterium]
MRGWFATVIALVGCRQLLGLDTPSHASDAGVDGSASVADGRALDGPATGSIVVTAAAQADGDVNLTDEGTLDWAHWGLMGSSFDHKLAGVAIGNATGTAAALQNVAVTASWSDGTPDATVTATGTGLAVMFGPGVTLSVAASAATQTLKLYVGGRACQGKLQLALSDGSAPAYSDDQFQGTGTWHAAYTIEYETTTPGASLTVTWSDEMDLGLGYGELLSATLQ